MSIMSYNVAELDDMSDLPQQQAAQQLPCNYVLQNSMSLKCCWLG